MSHTAADTIQGRIGDAAFSVYAFAMSSKSELRQQLRQRRAAILHTQRHAAALHAAAHFARLPALRHAHRVALYLEYGSELGTRPLLEWLWGCGFEVCVPRLRAGAMHFVRLQPATRTRLNGYGIAEPVGRCLRRSVRSVDIVVMPLTAFDRLGNRLGTGGGYYDRALAAPRALRKPLRVGYAYALQQVDRIPAEAWDLRLDVVVTEQGAMQWPTG